MKIVMFYCRHLSGSDLYGPNRLCGRFAISRRGLSKPFVDFHYYVSIITSQT